MIKIMRDLGKADRKILFNELGSEFGYLKIEIQIVTDINQKITFEIYVFSERFLVLSYSF